ncbi:TNT domain-containing protein [Xenorhabdus thailandensis]|uniref:TNT domain-containing protein n=1 Tax=Xenorhabdus thailandensis TaxID=3136255 RepID=UPI0030F4A2CC
MYKDGKYQLSTRAGGLIQAAGGAVEIIGGAVSCGTGIGCAVGAVMATQGIDNLYTGSNILESGKPIKTMGAQGLEALGVPPEYSEITYAAIGLGGSVTTVLTSPKTGKTVTVLVDKDNRITRSFSDKGNVPNGNSTPKQTNLPSNTIADAEAGGYSYYDKFRNKDGSWNWPKNLGFAEDPVKTTLPVGMRLDRYGEPNGSFLAPQGTLYEQRALAPGARAEKYYEYEVIKPLPVLQGKIAPAFEQQGGGMQILPALEERVNVQWLIDNKYIKEVSTGLKSPKTGKFDGKSLPNADKGAKSESVGKTTSGAENIATYPKLKEDLTKQNLNHIASQDPRLAAVIKGDNGKVNYGVGTGTRADADRLGKIWVGDGARPTTDGTGLVSTDGTRVYRYPKEKPNAPISVNPTGVQANFETYTINPITGQKVKIGDGHLNVFKEK